MVPQNLPAGSRIGIDPNVFTASKSLDACYNITAGDALLDIRLKSLNSTKERINSYFFRMIL